MTEGARKKTLARLVLLGKENPSRHDVVIGLLKDQRKTHLYLKEKHFGYDVKKDVFGDVSDYFSGRIMEVYGDLLDMTYPATQ